MTRLCPLVAAGVALEVVWVLTAALTYPLTGSMAYAKTWSAALGPVWGAFEWLLLKLDTVSPGLFRGDPPHPAAFALFIGLLFVSYAVYLFAIYLLDNGPGSHPVALRVVAIFAVVFQMTLFLMPGILTTDLATYVVYGRIAGVYGANPYVVPPSAFPNDPFLPWWIGRMWYTTTATYGPLWMDVSWVIARLTGSSDYIPQLLSYRLLINLAELGNLALAWWLVQRLTGTARLATFVAFAWSPLLLFQIAANAHSDALMILLMLLAVAALARDPGLRLGGAASRISNRAWLLALTCLALATLLKWAPAIPAFFCTVAWARSLTDWRQRIVWLGGTAVFLAALSLLIAAPWIPGLLAPGPRQGTVLVAYAHWVLDVPAAWVATHVLDREGLAIDQARATARTLFLAPALVVFAGLIALEVRRVWRVAGERAPLETIRTILGASTRMFLVLVVLVSPQVADWYFSWPLALGLLLGWRNMTARVALAYSLLFPPVAYLREQTGNNPVDPLLVAYAVLPLALPLAAWLRRQPHLASRGISLQGRS